MTAIGHVTKLENGSYKGHLKTLVVRAEINIVPNSDKIHAKQPDFRVIAQGGAEIGAGWVATGETSGKPYVRLTLHAPGLGKLYANLGRAAGQDDDDVFAVIWSPAA